MKIKQQTRTASRQTENRQVNAKPRNHGPATLLQLQQMAGNQAVGQLIQTKLASSNPRDDVEQEAGRVSDHGTPEAVNDVLQTPGKSLDDQSLDFFQNRFGVAFENVRIHDDGRAAQSAEALNAKAYTVGENIVFNSNQYSPHSPDGKRLLGHELTHVVQQQGGLKLQRQPQAGTATATTTPTAFAVPWRGSFLDSYISFCVAAGSSRLAAERIAKGAIAKHHGWTAKGVSYTDKEFTEYMNSRDSGSFILTNIVGKFIRTELGLPEGKLEETASMLKQEKRTLKKTEDLSGQPYKAFAGDYTVLRNPELAKHYLQVIEHYTNFAVTTDEWMKKASDGLSAAEVAEVISLSSEVHTITNIYTQGWREFLKANGTKIRTFAPVIRTIIEQFQRGNPNALANQLRIGYGEPGWDKFGIANRRTNELWYDQFGNPLPTAVGLLFKDHGYRGAPPPQWAKEHGVDVQDPAVRLFFNMLRQQYGDPALIIKEAAHVYKENIDLVNDRVTSKLDEQIKKQFLDSLPFFIGFLAGHGLSWLLLRMTHPAAVAAGLALRGLLTAAGYMLSIQTSVNALERLTDAARHLIQVKKNQEGKFTVLSDGELDQAAEIIKTIVADIAITAGTLAIGALIKKGARLRISCTKCRITTRMIDSNGKLTPEGISHLRKKYPGKFAGEPDSFVQEAFAKDLTVERKGTFLEELVLEEIEQTHREQATAKGAGYKAFLLRNKSFKTILAELEKRSPGSTKNNQILSEKLADFAKKDPVLQAEMKKLDNHPIETVRTIWKEWLAENGNGTIGNKRPDMVEVFPDRNLAILTDPTLAATSEFGPIHGFKTLVYQRVLALLTGWDVGSMDVGAGIFSLID